MRVKIAIVSAIFNWISKQKVNLSLFLLDLYRPKFGLIGLLGYDRKFTSDKKVICKSYQRYKGENRNHCNHLSVIFEAASKFLTVLVRLILGKVGVDRFIRPQQKIDNRYEFGFNIILKDLGCKQRLLQSFFIKFLSYK